MIKRVCILPGLFASILLPVTGIAGDAPELQRNPFARPPSAVSAADPFELAAERLPATALVLHGTMVGSHSRFANVTGKVLAIGDEIYGYQLVEVHEDRAVFTRDGERRTVFVRQDKAEDNE